MQQHWQPQNGIKSCFLLCLMTSHDPVNFLINRMGVPKKFRPKKFLKTISFCSKCSFFKEVLYSQLISSPSNPLRFHGLFSGFPHKFWILNLTLSLREDFEKKHLLAMWCPIKPHLSCYELIKNDILFYQVTWTVRAILMTLLAFGVGLPLSMMRNLKSLSSFSAISLFFYAFFVVQVSLQFYQLMSNDHGFERMITHQWLNFATILFLGFLFLQIIFSALPRIVEGSWIYNLNYWRPEKLLNYVPIFALAFACQP